MARKACDRCVQWKRACRDIIENDDGGKTCRTCRKSGIQCTYTIRSHIFQHRTRTGKRVEEARRLFGGEPSKLIVVQEPGTTSQSAPCSATSQEPVVRSGRTISEPPQLTAEIQFDEGIHLLGRQDSSTLSTENELRRWHRQGFLVFELISSAMAAINVGLLSSPMETRILALSIHEIRQIFDQTGLDLRNERLGPLGEIRLALYCAMGSDFSTHSEVLGGDTCVLPQIDLGLVGKANRNTQKSTISPLGTLRNTGMMDLREFGRARGVVQRRLWQRCLELCEKGGLLPTESQSSKSLAFSSPSSPTQMEESGDDNLEELRLLMHVYRYGQGGWPLPVPSFHPESQTSDDQLNYSPFSFGKAPWTIDEVHLRRFQIQALHKFKYIAVNGTFGGIQRGKRKQLDELSWDWREKDKTDWRQWFGVLLTSDTTLSLELGQPPLIPDEDILILMAETTIDPHIYLTFNEVTANHLIRDLESHHKVCWGTHIALERMICTAFSTISNLPFHDAHQTILDLFNTLTSRERWRRTTFEYLKLPNGKFGRLTPYGLESFEFSKREIDQIMKCWFVLLRMVNEFFRDHHHDQKVSLDPDLRDVKRECLARVELFIADVASMEQNTSFAYARRKIRYLQYLPGGIGYLTHYLEKGGDEMKIARRNDQVLRILEYCKWLSFEGQPALSVLDQLERALQTHFRWGQSSVSTSSPRFLMRKESENIDELVPKMVSGALDELYENFRNL